MRCEFESLARGMLSIGIHRNRHRNRQRSDLDEASQQRGTLASIAPMSDHARTGVAGTTLRIVVASVVDHDDGAVQALGAERAPEIFHDTNDGALSLVRGNDDGNVVHEVVFLLRADQKRNCHRLFRGRCAKPVWVDLDPELVQALIPKAKKQLRARMKALRAALPEAQRRAKSAEIVHRVAEHSAFSNARRVGLFWPIAERGEVDVRPLDAAARMTGKFVYYPFMDSSGDVFKTGFRPVKSPDELGRRGRAFKEPPRETPEAGPGELDLLVVPALAVAANGHRLGYGSGFYDATAPEFSPPAKLLAVAYDFQLLAEVPAAVHDVPVHIIVTDRRSLFVRGEDAPKRDGEGPGASGRRGPLDT